MHLLGSQNAFRKGGIREECCYGMGKLPSTVKNESFFRIPVPAKISCHVPEKYMAEAVTRNMAASDWLKLAALCLFRAQSVSKNKSIL